MSLSYEIDVSWGDCDPAGIVFYPCYFRWFDTGMHKLLAAAGIPQQTIQPRFGFVGAALVSAKCDFRRPVAYGDVLTHQVSITEWHARRFVVAHTFSIGGEATASGTEIRICLIKDAGGAAKAIPIPEGFRAALEGSGTASRAPL